MSILRVALDVPLDTLFDYSADDVSNADIGRRVLVPFGRKQMIGVILEVSASTTVSAPRLKRVLQVMRDMPPVPKDTLALLRFCSEYYHHPLGEVVMGALPIALRRVKTPVRRTAVEYKLTSAGCLADESSLSAREKAARSLLSRLKLANRLERTGPRAL